MRIIILFIFCFVSLGCAKKSLSAEFFSYPYLADQERTEKIRTGVEKLQVGDSIATAISNMGRPDELNPTFDKDDWDKRIGYSLVYVIRRDVKYGSVLEKNEKLVRIHFNFNDVVTRIDLVEM